MYLAEIRGKLSSLIEKKEDVLTSNVFSFFKYADRAVFLKGYLHELGVDISKHEAKQAIFEFWPQYQDGTEPDVVIQTNNYYLLLEAKYFSDFGKETPKTKAQLTREVENGKREANNQGKLFKLIAITADSYERPERLDSLPKGLIPFCKWTNWQTVAKYLKQVLENQQGMRLEDKIFASDLYELLDKKNLRSFIGLSESLFINKALKAQSRIFFDAKMAKFRGDFIGFDESLSAIKPLMILPNYIFLNRRKQLFLHSEYPFMNNRINTPVIFFRRS